ncbi:heme-thiolate peroxidase [Leucocoprinus birnbaumii]|uniref:Heme-thiolate peroxidase n=1 Tax=Leucocoprinus birnbaumii TaxID=56174 RepID=A0AAD5YL71_9AGAR|nr:heme-thiolate peroxidase [Leucocoprinus birnbaumii]
MNILFKLVHDLVFLTWDTGVTVLNVMTPNKGKGHVVSEGHAGYRGHWPEYIPPKEGDSRCACPALNAMANHGILPHDGKNIQFKEIGRAVRATYNFSSTFCYFVPHYAAEMLKKSYSKDRIDLSELNLHNGIEHDASLVREDEALQPDQSKPHIPFITELLSSASGKDKETGEPIITAQDLSRFSSKRRVDARETNKDFSLDFMHKMFGSINASTMLAVFGGRVKDLETWLIQERIPEGWETKVRQRFGITLAQFNITVFGVELGINEKRYIEEKRKAEEAAQSAEGGSKCGTSSFSSVP